MAICQRFYQIKLICVEECQQTENTSHLLLSCTTNDRTMSNLHKEIKLISLSNRIELEDILGEGDYNIQKQIKIRKLLNQFFTDTKKKI